VARGGAAAKVEGGMQIKTADGYVFKLKEKREKKIVPPEVKEPSVEGVLQCISVRCSVFCSVFCSLLQCVAVCCSVMQCVTGCCNVLHKESSFSASGTQCVAVRCSVF